MYRKYLLELGCSGTKHGPSNQKKTVSDRRESEPEVPAESTSTSHQQETKVAVKPTPLPFTKPPDVPDKKSDPASTKVKDDFKKRNTEDLDKLKKQADDLMKMITESMTTLENSVKKDAVYQGYLNKEFSSPARIIRIFTSSTFTDTMHERNRMMETTFPRLKKYCQQRGFEFQIVDMRWGIRDEATNDHMTTEICLYELANCQKYSAGPNFLTLLSHKYGYRSLPRKILAEKYEKIIAYIDISDQQQLFSKWYVKDENYDPPKYILQPISTNLPEFLEQDDKEKQKAAREKWWEESDTMLDVLVTAAEKALPQEEAYKLKVSVTHTEVMSGLSSQDLGKKCVWLKRNITDIEEQKPSYQLSRFIECNGPDEKVKMVKTLLEDLKGDLTKKLPAENILSYNVSWQEKGLDPSIKEHSEYLDKITDDSERKLKQLIDDIIAADKKKKSEPVKDEIRQHLLFCQTKCADFKGKEDTLEAVHTYLKSDKKHPLVIHGESGSGKTSLMAMIAKKANEWFDGKATVVIRFLGTTPKSSNLFDLLCSLTSHIRTAKLLNHLNAKSFKEVELIFKQTLIATKGSDKTKISDPLIIILDSLDQLDPSYNARGMQWLPLLVNPNVKIIVSTLEEPKYEVFPNLKNRVPADGFIPVATIPRPDVKLILNHWLERIQRKLTPEQEDLLLKSYDQCPFPLYLNLCFREASQWTSYMDVSSIHLFQTVREAINGLFAKMESLHGYAFVSKTLGYLTAAKIGLTETELEDILACDDDVLNDVYVYWTPPIRRLPPLLLVRLRHDLQQYFVERGADGSTVIYWYHRQFIEAAKDRYCTEETSVTNLHTSLADYFLGTWANGNKKPYVNRSGESGLADRHVVTQPIKFGDTYNLRKLNNLPYHLTMSKRVGQLKDECLMNLPFINAKLECSSVRSLMEDYEIAKQMINDSQLNMIQQALLLSGDSILFNAKQFAPQMFLRLKNVKELQTFTDACKQTDVTYLCPDTELLVKVGGPLVYALGGHKSQVDWVDMKKDGKIAVTASSDDHSVGLWDVQDGKVIRIMERIVKDPNEVHFVADDSLILVYSSKSLIAVTELGEKKYTFSHEAMKSFCVCGKNKEVLVGFMKTRVVHLYDMRTGEKTDVINPKDGLTEEEKLKLKVSFGLFASGSDKYAICTDDDENAIWVVDLEKKQAYCSPRIRFPPTPAIADEDPDDFTIDASAVTRDGKYIVASNMYDNVPYLFDIKTFEICRKLSGDDSDTITKYKFSVDGKKMYGESSKTIVVIDLETGNRQKVLHHSNQIDCCVSNDATTFVTVSDDSVLRVWDTSKTTFSEEKLSDFGTSVQFFKLLANERYALMISSFGKDKKHRIMVVDTVEKKIVSQAESEAKSRDVLFLNDSKAIMCFTKDNKPHDLHLIDLNSMTENPVQGKMFKDCYTILKVNNGKEFMVPTRGGKNVKFYSTETLKANHIMKIVDTSSVGRSYETNSDGSMVVLVTDDDKKIMVIDVEAKTIVKVLEAKDLKKDLRMDDDFCGAELLVPDNMSYIVFTAYTKDSTTAMYLWDLKEDKLKKELTDFEMHKKYKILKEGDSVDVCSFVLLDDDTIMSTHDDKLLRVWSTKNGSLLKRIIGHRSTSSNIYYTPKSPYVLTYGHSQEQTLRIWDKKTYQQIASFKLDKELDSIEWCSDGLSFVSYSRDPTLIVRWTLEGANVQKSSLSKYPATFKGNVSDSEVIPILDIKEVEVSLDDLDQEEQAPDTDTDEDDDEDDED
ncbi:NACHT domain- and WD repeat-containing protein 1-like isoform X1 [Mytilus galloprovincialis]|uniref:NACHT domain- and WD repeat-containing protein 1-like isoform X1 n=3 Tax=Mytilus galloprovincialis TaxID=29158 RepID=UPI003F7C74EC